MNGAAAAESPWAALDHLVVAARSLDVGSAWCEATLGVTPEPGGRHAGIGTHNRLLAVGGRAFPRSYLEIIAIDPEAPQPPTPRWFDLDDAALQQLIAAGPRLVHWVARTPDIDAGCRALRAAGHDPGSAVAAGRMTPRGPLSWRITRRSDGVRPAAGAVPALIEWGDVHPADALPAAGVEVERVAIGGVAPALAHALGVAANGATDAPPLCAVLSTRRGVVTLDAPRSLNRRGAV